MKTIKSLFGSFSTEKEEDFVKDFRPISRSLMLRRNVLLWILFGAVAMSIFFAYYAINRAIGGDDIIMPLDDVYIHFQYARQLATGHPYVYNNGDLPTSGATSFIYPYILAFGYLIGFQGLNLGIWSMLIGLLALWASMWAIYRLCLVFSAPKWLAILMPIIFAYSGSIAWHVMSGMETALMMCFSLWTLLAFIEKSLNIFVISAILLALTRPEGSVMVGIATILYFLQTWRDKSTSRSQIIYLALPLLAIGIQPLVNLLVTGSFSASGSQAKSILAQIPRDWNLIIGRILENFLRIWSEFFTGYSPSQEIWYLPPLIVPLGLLGIVLLFRVKVFRATGLLIILWLLSVSIAIATLDTAFWHFKRYQMPLMVLFLPLSVYAIVWFFNKSSLMRYGSSIFVTVILPICVILTAISFHNLYAININLVREQPLAMARWLEQHTPEDALIAVHDVGMMRYIGGRDTLDMVGLTTPFAAQYWRNGVGAVAEFLLEHQPDYIASYGRGHGYGLYMLADTRLYANALAEFPVEYDLKTDVALAAPYQAIYQPDWEDIIADEDLAIAQVNVANIESEQAANYEWHNPTTLIGFASEVYDFPLLGCEVDCQRIEAGRRITGEESFTLTIPDEQVGYDFLLVTRIHPAHAGTLKIYANDSLIDTRWIPQIAGSWLDLKTVIPQVTQSLNVRITAQMGEAGFYMPTSHRLFAYEIPAQDKPQNPLATYQDGHIQLADYSLELANSSALLTLDWWSDGEAQGDYRFFVHVYDDLNQPPIAQDDSYPINGTLPSGNWLSGRLRDTIKLDIASLPSGNYQVAIGFYEPFSQTRLIPQSNNDAIQAMADGRLILQDLEIK